jgi:GDPmannose 4,6-dehydratase
MKKAIIIGASGQDGSFLTKFLLKKNYEIICTSRNKNADEYYNHDLVKINKSKIVYEKLNTLNLKDIKNILNKYNPDEIYNLGAQSSVGLSYTIPLETMNSIINSTLNILESIRFHKTKIKFYNAGSGEAFGNYEEKLINEESCFRPLSPYAVAKASSSMLVKSYRESYNINCCTGHLFNHESYLRSEKFVTKKIILSAIKIFRGELDFLKLGNIDISRDWGWAPEYVEVMWMMLQQKTTKDYIISTGVTSSLTEFISIAFDYFNLNYQDYLVIDKSLLRPSDIKVNKSDPTLAKKDMGWSYKTGLKKIVTKLIEHELNKK